MDTRKILGKILKSIRPYRLLVILSLLLAVISVVLTLYIPILTGRGVDRIIDRGLVDFEGLLEIIRNILVCILLTAGSQWLMNHINNKITYHSVQDLRIRAFRHLQKLPLSYIDYRSGYNSGNHPVYALHPPADYACGGGFKPPVLSHRGLYLQKNLFHVPETV